MPIYKIRIDKPNKKAPHYKIVRAPSIQSAEFFAIKHMILPAGGVTLDDHFKMGYVPYLNQISRSTHKSIFQFQSDMVEKDSPASRIRIVETIDANPSEHYAIDHDESIFELWDGADDAVHLGDVAFFTEADLRHFSDVIGKQFSRGSLEAIELKERLAEQGVFAKTEHWAQLLRQKGFVTEFRYDWQHSGRVRGYTWARVFLPDLKTPDVFFTVGVGSRLSEGDVSSLEYKLDCRRDKLSEQKINQFDEYVENFCPDSRRHKIEHYQLNELNWEVLIERTVSFINQYESEYRLLTNLITENTLPRKLARLCWNECGWEKPTGAVGKSKTTAKSFEREKGYGHEEWFFETEKQIDGYHYAFLQAFNKGDHEGESYDTQLYAIKDSGSVKQKFWVGRVRHLEVLTKEEAAHVVKIYKERGWLSERLKQLQQLGISKFGYDIIPENEIFNVRYAVTSSNFVRYQPFRKIEHFDKEIGSNHYVLLDKKPGTIDLVDSGKFQFTEGHNDEAKKGQVTASVSSTTYTKNLLHEEMKAKIHNQLKTFYSGTGVKVGTENNTGHGTAIDIAVNDPIKGFTFYEIKTGNSALSCIREALGQIIEYCYYPTNQNAAKLVIVSPHSIDVNIQLYMKHLRKVLGIEIYYQSYSITEGIMEDIQA